MKTFTNHEGRQSLKSTRAEMSETLRYQKERGFVLVGDPHDSGMAYRYEDKRYVVRVRGKWVKKIDHLMDVLGPETVTRELKEITGKKTWAELVGSAGWVEAYHRKLDELLVLAMHKR